MWVRQGLCVGDCYNNINILESIISVSVSVSQLNKEIRYNVGSMPACSSIGPEDLGFHLSIKEVIVFFHYFSSLHDANAHFFQFLFFRNNNNNTKQIFIML